MACYSDQIFQNKKELNYDNFKEPTKLLLW